MDLAARHSWSFPQSALQVSGWFFAAFWPASTLLLPMLCSRSRLRHELPRTRAQTTSLRYRLHFLSRTVTRKSCDTNYSAVAHKHWEKKNMLWESLENICYCKWLTLFFSPFNTCKWLNRPLLVPSSLRDLKHFLSRWCGFLIWFG